MGQLAWIALGGAAGASARFVVARWAERVFGAGVPVGTAMVNVLGSLALGALVGALTRAGTPPTALRAGLGIGFLGAFTTFSTYAVDTVVVGRTSVSAAVVNIAVNNVLALLAAVIGFRLAAA